MKISRDFKVYKHTFPNGKVYIGITGMRLSERWVNGFGYSTQNNIFRAIVKYGWKNIKHEILYDNLTEKEALYIESKLIERYNSNDSKCGYNSVKRNINKPNRFIFKTLKRGTGIYRESYMEFDLEGLYI